MSQITAFVTPAAADRLHFDHADQDYMPEDGGLLISCHGYYSLAELLYKVSLVREANAARYANPVTVPASPRAVVLAPFDRV